MAEILLETDEVAYAFAISKDGETAYFFKKKAKKLDTKWYEELRRWLSNIEKVAKNKNLDEINQENFWNQWNIYDGYALNKKEPNKKFKVQKSTWRILYSS